MLDLLEPRNLSFVQWKYEDPPRFHPVWFEELLEYDAWKKYAADNWIYSFYASTLYLITIFGLKHVMKHRAPMKLHAILVVWNLCLSAFSLAGFLRTGQELLHVLAMPDGFHKSLCTRVGLNPPAAFYSVTFALSKFVELGDTVFIVLRKKRLVFIQWYHHSVTLLLAWQVMPYSEPIFRYYGIMNYGIHFFLYLYYAVTVLNYNVGKFFKMTLTILQTLQMMIGVLINFYTAHLIGLNGPDSCARDPVSIQWIGGVYTSFMILFAHFFFETYISKRKAKAT